MKKIELSKDEIKVIKQQLDGKIELWSATEEQKKLLMGVIGKADALMDEMDASDALEEDRYLHDGLIGWFYDQYKAQEGIGK